MSDDLHFFQTAALVVEKAGRIIGLAIDAHLKVEMFGRSPSGASGQGDRLSGLYPIANLDKVFGIVAVQGLHPVGVTHDHHTAIAVIIAREANTSGESGKNLVVRLCFKVDAGMATFSAVGTDDLGTRQG